MSAADTANVVYEAKGRRDPFVPIGRRVKAVITGLNGVESADDLTVEGVVVDPKKGSYVIVNGEILAAGETKEGITAMEIRQDGVKFKIHGKTQFKSYAQPSGTEEEAPSDPLE